MKSSQIMSELGRRWAALSEEDKLPYHNLAAEDKSRYEKEKAEFGPIPSTRKRVSKDASAEPKAKRAPSAYNIFMKEKRAEVKEEKSRNVSKGNHDRSWPSLERTNGRRQRGIQGKSSCIQT
ncbi:hypothetical protein GEMRC1_008772 [Eukaryota sp. GEM-RC1]